MKSGLFSEARRLIELVRFGVDGVSDASLEMAEQDSAHAQLPESAPNQFHALGEPSGRARHEFWRQLLSQLWTCSKSFLSLQYMYRVPYLTEVILRTTNAKVRVLQHPYTF